MHGLQIYLHYSYGAIKYCEYLLYSMQQSIYFFKGKCIHLYINVKRNQYICNAGQRLIASKIKVFVYIINVCTVYIYYVYINTHMHVYI